ncbi:MAG: diguanylate cyclase [Roseburia sp.]|nr:diguanylate cyclase [Roseburia sp.]
MENTNSNSQADKGLDKKITYAYIVLLILGTLLIILEYKYADNGVVYDVKSDVRQEEMIPDRIEVIDEDTREFYFTDVKVFGESDCFVFYSCHLNVEVYQGDKLLYQVKKGSGIFDRTTGLHWNFVQLEQKASFIKVRVEALYPQMREYKFHFYKGNSYKIFMENVTDSFFNILVSIMDMAIGIVLFAYWVTLRKRLKSGNGLLYFGIFSILMGLWSFNETTICQMIISNRPAASDMGYVLIMLFPVPFVLFARDFLEIQERKISNAICILSYINSVFCLVLHFAGILANKQTAITTHLLIIAALFYMVYALRVHVREVGFDSRAWVNMAGLLILMATCVLDLSAFYLKAGSVDVIGRLGLLFYIILVGFQAVRDILKQLDQGYQAQRLVQLADIDSLTGLYNRNTYDKWVNDHPRPEGTTMLTFDLNYLKKCNDTLGHAMGDLYIQSAAKIISQVFEEKGKCYRIGGDEYCVIVNSLITSAEMEEKFAQIEKLEKEYTPKEAGIPIQIAHGFAYFDKYQDADIEKCRERADKKMYENKQLRKEKG